MHYLYWIAGVILALAWFSRIVDAALGMPSVADVSRPEWDRDPVMPSGNPRVSIIVPARNEEETIEQALKTMLALDYDNYEIIAVNDRSTDRTGEIMERVASQSALDSGVELDSADSHPSKIAKSGPPFEGQNPHFSQHRGEVGYPIPWRSLGLRAADSRDGRSRWCDSRAVQGPGKTA